MIRTISLTFRGKIYYHFYFIGRGKLKKLAGPLVLALGAKVVALLPLFLGGLVLLATKALVVAKVAFVLAAVLAVQKLLGSSGGFSGSGFNLLGKVNNI